MNSAIVVNKRQQALVICLIYLFLAIALQGMRSQDDYQYWLQWARHIHIYGLSDAYQSGTDYPPLYQYILWVYSKMQQSVTEVDANIRSIKAFILLFDFLGVWLIYRWMDKSINLLWLIILCVVNPAFMYDTLFWGQVDAVLSALTFGTLYTAWKQKIGLSVVLMMLALNFKIQAIIFLPLWGLLILFSLADTKNWKKLLTGIVAAAVLELMILWPFIQSAESIQNLKTAVFGSVGRYPYLSWYAFNIWYFAVDKPWTMMDYNYFIGPLNANSIGLILFFLSSGAAMFPIVVRVWKRVVSRKDVDIPRQMVWLTGGLIPLLFFFLNTQMHERYSHPAFLFLIAYAFYIKDYLALILFSIAFFLNVEVGCQWLGWNNYETFMFEPRFVASIYAVCIAYCFVRLYKPRVGGELYRKAE